MTIKEIEDRKEIEVINILKSAGLGMNKRKRFQDYSQAKRLIFEGKFIECDIYDKQIGWICKYLGI